MTQLFFLLLSIFSGGLWGIDLFFVAVIGITLYTANKEAKAEGVRIWHTSPFVLSCLAFLLWIISLPVRAHEI